jgi:hypothetical protein
MAPIDSVDGSSGARTGREPDVLSGFTRNRRAGDTLLTT